MNRLTNIFFQLKLIIVFSILFSSCETEYQEEYGIAFATVIMNLLKLTIICYQKSKKEAKVF
jgi:hypothetical protein